MAVDKSPTDSGRPTPFKNTVAVVACLAVLALILPLAFRTGNPPDPTTDGAEPLPSSAQLQARDAEILSAYGWIDEENGVVRLPISRARELFIDEINP